MARVRKIASRYPQVMEVIDGFGHTVFKVRGKSFIFVGGDGSQVYLTLRVLHETQDFLTQHTKRWVKSAYIGQHGWTTSLPGEVDWDEVAGLIDEAYRRTAPKTLLAKLAADR